MYMGFLFERLEMLATELDMDAGELFREMIEEYEDRYYPIAWEKGLEKDGIDVNSLDVLCAGWDEGLEKDENDLDVWCTEWAKLIADENRLNILLTEWAD